MTKRNAVDVSFFVLNGLDLLGTLTEFDDMVTIKTEESHTLGDNWVEATPVGDRAVELTQQGFYDDAANSAHEILSTGPGISRVLSYGLEGTATGARFVGWSGAMQINYERQARRGELTKAIARYRNNGIVEEGKILFTWKALAATGKQNTVDNTVSSTGAVGYLQYYAASGATGNEANIRVLHSSDNITFATLLTFAKSSSRSAERLTTTGSIKRYTAADVTTASATGSSGGQIASRTFFVGLKRISTAP